jgi:serine/threonine protein kinase
MPLSPGTHLGPYEILAPIGAGGMGEVYRARDTKLDRDVAIKVLPATLAQDPERLARFEREAKVLAALNHPNMRMPRAPVCPPDGVSNSMMPRITTDYREQDKQSGLREEARQYRRPLADHHSKILHRRQEEATVSIRSELCSW